MIFHDFEGHSGNYVTKNQGKSGRCPAFAADSAYVRQAPIPNVAPRRRNKLIGNGFYLDFIVYWPVTK
jgi:hypothetical protein